MSNKHHRTADPDTRLENLAAELTSAVYPLALRRGSKDSWVNLELGLWRALSETLTKWDRQRPPGASAAELGDWGEGLLVDLTESAFYVALKNGVRGPLLEVELGFYRAFRLEIRRSGRLKRTS
jgi:hypothetical protein